MSAVFKMAVVALGVRYMMMYDVCVLGEIVCLGVCVREGLIALLVCEI